MKWGSKQERVFSVDGKTFFRMNTGEILTKILPKYDDTNNNNKIYLKSLFLSSERI